LTDYDEFDEQDPENGSPAIQQLRKREKELEKQLKEAQEAATSGAEAERKLAFMEAGVTLNPKTKYFVEGYKGELTAEAIQAAAREAEILPPLEPDVPPEELAQHNQLANASVGANGSKVDWNARLREAQSQEEVMQVLQEAGVPTTWDAQ
jgi:hypothetical protein